MVRARMRATFRRMLQALLVLVAVYVAITALFTWQQDRLVFPGAGLGDRGVPPDVAGGAGSTLQRADGGRFRIVTVPPAGPLRAGAGDFVGNGGGLDRESTRLNSSHRPNSYARFFLIKKKASYPAARSHAA